MASTNQGMLTCGMRRTTKGMLTQVIRVAKFWRVYAGDLPIEEIDDKVMRSFIPWRRDYFKDFPTEGRLQKSSSKIGQDVMGTIRMWYWPPALYPCNSSATEDFEESQ
jgi:hypothetical protein